MSKNIMEITEKEAIVLRDILETKCFLLNVYSMSIAGDFYASDGDNLMGMSEDEAMSVLKEFNFNLNDEEEELTLKLLLGQAEILELSDGFFIKEIESKKSHEKGFVSTEHNTNSEYKGLKRVIFFSVQPSRIKHEVMFENVKDYAVQALGSMSMLNMVRSNGNGVAVKLSKYDGYKVEDM